MKAAHAGEHSQLKKGATEGREGDVATSGGQGGRLGSRRRRAERGLTAKRASSPAIEGWIVCFPEDKSQASNGSERGNPNCGSSKRAKGTSLAPAPLLRRHHWRWLGVTTSDDGRAFAS